MGFESVVIMSGCICMFFFISALDLVFNRPGAILLFAVRWAFAGFAGMVMEVWLVGI